MTILKILDSIKNLTPPRGVTYSFEPFGKYGRIDFGYLLSLGEKGYEVVPQHGIGSLKEGDILEEILKESEGCNYYIYKGHLLVSKKGKAEDYIIELIQYFGEDARFVTTIDNYDIARGKAREIEEKKDDFFRWVMDYFEDNESHEDLWERRDGLMCLLDTVWIPYTRAGGPDSLALDHNVYSRLPDPVNESMNEAAGKSYTWMQKTIERCYELTRDACSPRTIAEAINGKGEGS